MPFIYRYPPGIEPGSAWLQLEPYFTLQRETFFAHAHEFMELTLITQGRGRHRCGGQGQATAAGDLIFCPPGLVHQHVDCEGQTHRNIHFDPSLLEGLRALAPELKVLDELFPAAGAPSRRLRLTPKELASIELQLRELEREQGEAQSGRSAAIQLLFQRILLQCARWAEQRQSGREQGQGRKPASAGLAAARKLLHEQAQQPHSVASLARVAGLSPSHFRRLFRQAYGEAPIKLLIRERVRSACGPLESGGQSITEIAHLCGFEDGNYFSRQFKQVMGTSPQQYRELFRRDDVLA